MIITADIAGIVRDHVAVTYAKEQNRLMLSFVTITCLRVRVGSSGCTLLSCVHLKTVVNTPSQRWLPVGHSFKLAQAMFEQVYVEGREL